MRTKKFLVIAISVATIGASGSFAQTSGNSDEVAEVVVMASSIANLQVVIDLIETLKAEGYTYFEIRRTFLGRARVIAYSASEMREIIINPNTNEVLRDLVQENPGRSSGNSNGRPAQAGGNGNNGNNGNGNNGNGNNGNNGNGNNGGGAGNSGNGNGNGNGGGNNAGGGKDN